MGTGKGRVRKHFPLRAVLLGLMLMIALGTAADAAVETIQRLNVNKPDISVYYRPSKNTKNLEAYLSGEKLTFSSETVFSDTGEGIEYYLLVDVSGSIRDFNLIRQAIIRFREQKREQDRMVLITFGDDVTTVLTGDESQEDAAEIVGALEARDHTTMLSDAVKKTVSQMADTADPDNKQQVLVIISDGKPDTDNNSSIDNAQDTLIRNGIQTYTIAVENNEGDSKEAIGDYRSHFNDLANNTGGLPWTIDGNAEISVLNGLTQVKNDVLNGRKAVFTASSNHVSNQTEEFVLKFTDSGKSDSRNVRVDRHKEDTKAPDIESFAKNGENSFVISFTEPVLNADKIDSYRLTLDKKDVKLSRIEKEADDTYELILSEEIRNGDYHLSVQNVTDDSEEYNALKKNAAEIEINNIAPKISSMAKNSDENGFSVVFSEDVSGADNKDNYTISCDDKDVKISEIRTISGKEYNIIVKSYLKNADYDFSFSGIKDSRTGKNSLSEKERTVTVSGLKELNFFGKALRFLRKWWQLVLTVLVILIILFIVLFIRRVRSRKVTVVSGEVVESSNIERKVHVSVERQQPQKTVSILMSNGNNESKQIQKTINGSLCIGRSPKVCDIYCDDPMMSKQHFVLSVEKDGSVYVMDLASTNGTILNGRKITDIQRLSPGDEIRAGNICFRVEWS